MARTKAVLGAGARLADHLVVAYLAMNCPLAKVRQVLDEVGAQSKRRRDLPAEVLVFYVMALCLYRRAAYEEVLRVVVEGLRSVYGDEIGQAVASKAAISQGRTRLGAEPLARLYAQQVQPIGPPGMSGVWYRGLRVMGLDGSTLDVADEVANAQHYGYPGASRGSSAFPQLRFAALAECGTHVLVGAKMGPYRTSEHELAAQVLEHADDSMLILADRGFVGYPMWKAANQRHSKLVFRLRENQVLPVERVLPDGSYLSTLYGSTKARRDARRGVGGGEGFVVRVIEYELKGGCARPGPGHDLPAAHESAGSRAGAGHRAGNAVPPAVEDRAGARRDQDPPERLNDVAQQDARACAARVLRAADRSCCDSALDDHGGTADSPSSRGPIVHCGRQRAQTAIARRQRYSPLCGVKPGLPVSWMKSPASAAFRAEARPTRGESSARC